MSTNDRSEKEIEWEEHLRNQCTSGLSIERWCRNNHLKPHVFHYWKQKLTMKLKLTRSSFKELTDVNQTCIVIEYRAFRLHIDKSFDPSLLKCCVEALREAKC